MRAPGRLLVVATGIVATLSLWSPVVAAGPGTDFYATPDPMPKGAPGTILRSEPIPAPLGARAWRVLYKSRSADGADIAVSGVVVAPEGRAPKGGRPVVTWAHGTTGVADACAPSAGVDPVGRIPALAELLDAGYVVAATDYEGLGTEGVHPYLVGASEGAGVLDSARAARELREAGAGREVLVWGHSQGGHAALFAGEMAKRYAPELRLRGVVAGAPAAEPDRMMPVAASFPRAAGFYVLAAKGYADAYADELSEADYLTPEAAEAAKVADTGCVVDVIRAFSSYPAGLAPSDLTQHATVMRRFRESSAGNRPAGAPVLVVQGTADTIVAKAFTDRFVPKACAEGSVVDYRVYEGAGHVDVVPLAKPDILDWMAARIAGDAAADTCSGQGQSSSSSSESS